MIRLPGMAVPNLQVPMGQVVLRPGGSLNRNGLRQSGTAYLPSGWVEASRWSTTSHSDLVTRIKLPKVGF